MTKPYGVGEWDGYPMPEVPKNRKPLTEEEEKRISEELRKNVLKHAKITKNVDSDQNSELSRKIS